MKYVKIFPHYFIKCFHIFYSIEQFGLSIELSQPCVNNRIRSGAPFFGARLPSIEWPNCVFDQKNTRSEIRFSNVHVFKSPFLQFCAPILLLAEASVILIRLRRPQSCSVSVYHRFWANRSQTESPYWLYKRAPQACWMFLYSIKCAPLAFCSR